MYKINKTLQKIEKIRKETNKSKAEKLKMLQHTTYKTNKKLKNIATKKKIKQVNKHKIAIVKTSIKKRVKKNKRG